MNCFFATSRYFVKYFGLDFNRSTRLKQYSGKIISVVCMGRTVRVCTGESSGRTGDFRSTTGGGCFPY